MSIAHRPILWTTLAGVLVMASATFLYAYRKAIVASRIEAGLRQVEADLESGRLATARRRLIELAALRPDHPEVAYQLGACEMAQGRSDAAFESWARVRAGSRPYVRTAARWAEGLVNLGRYAEAERLLESARLHGLDPQTPTEDVFAYSRAATRLLRFQGRFADVRKLLLASWHLAPDPAAVIKEVWLLDTSPMPAEAWGRALDHAAEDDHRVWLGRANLAILTGRDADAETWLERCADRRPADPAVWRARLELARSQGSVPGVAEASRHLPSADFREAETLDLRAWIARQSGDTSAESSALKATLAADPGNPEVLERLSELEVAAGSTDRAEELRRRKGEVDRARDQYRKILLDDPDLASRAGELAMLTSSLGRVEDAAAWSSLSRGQPPRPVGMLTSIPLTPIPLGSPRQALAEALPTPPVPSGRSDPRIARAASFTEPRFTDSAASAGLDFRFDNGATALKLLPETMSGGVGILDYDGDGWLDVYVVQGGPLETFEGQQREPDRLFRNQGNGTFEDVTELAGIARLPRGYGMGVTVGDYDNDGHPDLFVSRLDCYALLRNRGDGSFEDATACAGLDGRRDNPSSAAFADLDNDGDLDLYVCHYMIWDPANPALCRNERGESFYCDPSKVLAAPDQVFRNDGGTFTNITREAGFEDPDGRGLGVVAADVDGDGWIDLYVANDGTANYLFRNLGGFRFEEVGLLAGVAGDAGGGYQAGMGVACGDLDGDTRLDLFVTNFYGESTTYYQNLGHGLFSDRTQASGLGVATRFLLGFGLALLDYDNDGRLDLIAANGHVNDNRPYYPYAMPALLMAGQGDGRLVPASSGAGPPWETLRVGRGLATGDLDNDGRVDALIVDQAGPLAYFHNQTESGHWLVLQLEGTTSNRDGVGARITVESQGRRQAVVRVGGGSYQSAHSGRLHVGLGTSNRIESLEVRWPSGQVDRHVNLAADTGYLVLEAAQEVQPLEGYQKR